LLCWAEKNLAQRQFLFNMLLSLAVAAVVTTEAVAAALEVLETRLVLLVCP
jgi:hypothetical protein